MRWGKRNSGLDRCKRKGRRDKVVCGQSQHGEVTICLLVFVCLAWARGWKKAHSISQTEGQILLNLSLSRSETLNVVHLM